MNGAPRLLMCPPDHFDVVYEINPWMSVERPALPGLAMRQWRQLRDRLSGWREVEIVAPQPGLPDMVFTANAGVASPGAVVPCRFVHPERRPEEAHFRAWFRTRGFGITELPEGVGFEGAGDCLAGTHTHCYWAGCGFRTERAAHALLATLLGAEVVSLRLVDPRFYHLDTCFAPLRGGYLMYFPGAFDASSRAAIRARIPPRRRIEVSEDDACRFACNAVNVDEHVLLNAASPALRERLRRAGFLVETVDLSEFVKAGGAARCLVLELPRGVRRSV